MNVRVEFVNTELGGLCASNGGTIDNCYATGSVTGNSRLGGLCAANGEASMVAIKRSIAGQCRCDRLNMADLAIILLQYYCVSPPRTNLPIRSPTLIEL